MANGLTRLPVAGHGAIHIAVTDYDGYPTTSPHTTQAKPDQTIGRQPSRPRHSQARHPAQRAFFNPSECHRATE